MKAMNYGMTGRAKVLSMTSARWTANGEASLITTAMTIQSPRYSISLIRLTLIGAIPLSRRKNRLSKQTNLSRKGLDPNKLNLSLNLSLSHPPELSWCEWRMSKAKRSNGYGRHEYLAAS